MRFLPNSQRTDTPATLTADVCSTLVPAGAHALACRPHKPALQQSVANRSSAAQPSDRDSRQPRRGCNAPLTALRRARKFVSWRVTFLTDEIDRRHGGRSNVGMSLRNILLRHRKAVSINRYSAQNDCVLSIRLFGLLQIHSAFIQGSEQGAHIFCEAVRPHCHWHKCSAKNIFATRHSDQDRGVRRTATVRLVSTASSIANIISCT